MTLSKTKKNSFIQGKNMILALNFKNNLVNIDDFIKNITKTNLQLILIPSFLQTANFVNDDRFCVGVQNFSEQDKTLTGEITVDMLKSLGVKYCLVGHSERRKNLDENSKQIVQKISVLLANNITPILCVGETSLGDAESIKEQISKQLCDSVIKSNEQKIIVAFEPHSAIGTGKVCDKKVIENITNFLKQNYNFKAVLYGGSVSETNCVELSQISSLDGFLIGKSSLDIKKVLKIIKNLEK